MRAQSQCWDDPVKEETSVHSSVLAWRILWTEEPGEGYSLWTHRESDTTERLTLSPPGDLLDPGINPHLLRLLP